jgi:hypothetical protein
LLTYLNAHSELYSLEVLKPENLFGLSERNITYVRDYLEIGDYVVTHGDVARKDAGMTAKCQMERYRTNGISAHVHRRGKYTKRGFRFTQEWIEAGCICKLVPDYLPIADWAHALVTAVYRDGTLNTELVEINDGRAIWGGKFYGNSKITTPVFA